MSYLHLPRIIFTGDFQADVATVNNDVRHFDNETFEKRFQFPREESSDINNGAWNPEGSNNFKLLNCQIIQGTLPDERVVNNQTDDILIGASVNGSPYFSNGKMVDLDPQMQMASELWAVKLRFSTHDGQLLLEGDILPVGFRDIQPRQFPNTEDDTYYMRNGQRMGACWASVLENLKWGSHAMKSPLLKALKLATKSNRIAVQLTSFGFYYSHKDGRFSLGRIMGCIGPWLSDEPDLFAPARRLYGAVSQYFRYSNFYVNKHLHSLTVDLGGSYPINSALGDLNINFPKVKLAVSKKAITIPQANPDHKYRIAPDQFIEIGTVVPASPGSWLLDTAGIVSFRLTKEALNLLNDHQLLLLIEEQGENIIYARESIKGIHIRADSFIFRMDPGDQHKTKIYAYQWGEPLAGININIALLPPMADQGGGLENDPAPPLAKIPLINFPAGKIDHPLTVVTNKKGVATFTMSGGNPENYRKYVDGQLYLFSYKIEGFPELDQYFFFGMMMDLICVHLRDKFEVPENPEWDDVAAIWTQFGNVYPIMSKYIVDMSKMEELMKYTNILLHSFTRDIHDATYMPVTRDLSKNKMLTLIKWLKNPIASNDNGPKRATEASLAVTNELSIDKTLSSRMKEITNQKGGFKDIPITGPFDARYTIESID
ncbi:hypothetical protein [Chitinophaga flava]|uniref:Uncharacterized protein n=1 Tax=Chitinophaga flava TaxID=2259036 RepID=A0A365XXC4_9BACT|nr:hypothetical protein [Chitinophaga flava]RBL90354.1 hypothetical protein DF182_28240 [Chitinophaga flava]